jgi:hypothetical protein
LSEVETDPDGRAKFLKIKITKPTYQLHACEITPRHTHKMHACEMHTREVYAREVYAREIHAYEMHTCL